MHSIAALEESAAELRRLAFGAALSRGAGHVASAMSLAEILTCLYLGGPMRRGEDGSFIDHLVLSKGHGSLALYAALALAGVLDLDELSTFARPGTRIGGEPNVLECPGVEASTGSLGHGLSIGLGMALSAKIDDSDERVFVILGDGECQEGSVWEAVEMAPALGLSNFVAVVDDNGIQKEVPTSSVVGDFSLSAKWMAFGWRVVGVDGHSVPDLLEALDFAVSGDGPCAIVAHTVKGKGISIMEGDPKWHYRMPRKRELPLVLEELGMEVGCDA